MHDNVYQAHLVLACGKLVLHKHTSIRSSHHDRELILIKKLVILGGQQSSPDNKLASSCPSYGVFSRKISDVPVLTDSTLLIQWTVQSSFKLIEPIQHQLVSSQYFKKLETYHSKAQSVSKEKSDQPLQQWLSVDRNNFNHLALASQPRIGMKKSIL